MELRKNVEKIKSNPKVVVITLFGSYVKSEQKPISDINIAVVLKNPTSKDEAEIRSLYSDKVDLVLFHWLPLHIQYEVIKHGKELFIRDADYFFEVKLIRTYLETNWLYRRFEGHFKCKEAEKVERAKNVNLEKSKK
jgi:hypothetical protein